MRTSLSRIAFITGASSGFGQAIAKKFASYGYDIIINARRKDRLEALSKELQEAHQCKVLVLPFDVSDRESVITAINNIPAQWKKIDVLVNNAGLALGRDYFEDASLDDWDTMIGTNLSGLLYVSKAVVPFMIERQEGHIINIGSTAAKEVYEKGNVYCATKHAVDAASQAMRIDLLRHGIKVTAIHPGAAETEFSQVRLKGNHEAAAKVYEGYRPLVAEDIAEIAFYCASLPPHVCINDLVVTCTSQANSYYLHKG